MILLLHIYLIENCKTKKLNVLLEKKRIIFVICTIFYNTNESFEYIRSLSNIPTDEAVKEINWNKLIAVIFQFKCYFLFIYSFLLLY